MSKQVEVTVLLPIDELNTIMKYSIARDYVEAVRLAVAKFSDIVSEGKEINERTLPKPEDQM